MAIAIRDQSGRWVQSTPVEYGSEAELQTLIYDSPSLLEGLDDGGLVFTREAPLSLSTAADLLGVRADGALFLVETKLARNPEIRRKVLGQILEYASLLWKMSYQTLEGFFTRDGGLTLYDRVAKRLGDSGSAGDHLTSEQFRAKVEANLEQGRIRLLIIVDSITDELERIVAYIASLGSGLMLEAVAVRKHRLDQHEAVVLLHYGLPQVRQSPAASPAKLTIAQVLERSESPATMNKMESIIQLWNAVGDSIEPGTGGISCKSLIRDQKVSFFWATPTEQWGLQPQYAHLEQRGLPTDLGQWLRSEVGSLPGFDLDRNLKMSYPTTKFSRIELPALHRFMEIIHECADRWRSLPSDTSQTTIEL